MSLNINDIVTDGSAKFKVVKNATTEDISNSQDVFKRELGFRQKNTTYQVDDVAYNETLPTGYYLSCVTAGNTSNTNLVISDISNNITDGSVTWKVLKIGSGSGEGIWEFNDSDSSISPKDLNDLTPSDLGVNTTTLQTIVNSIVDEKLEYIPIGTVIPFSGNNAIPEGYLLCNGSAVSRSIYSDLFEVIRTTYGEGDGSTTFNLPDLTDKFIEGSTMAGTMKNAGLPNITGEVDTGAKNGLSNGGAYVTTATGSFYRNPVNAISNGGTNGGTDYSGFSFDASLSNPIYGNSNTVQPPALTMRYIIKAFNGMTAESALIDVTQFANEIVGKANRQLNNLDTANLACHVVVDSYYNDTTGDWWREYDDGWVEQGGVTTGNGTYGSGKVVTFLKPFADTNYHVSVVRADMPNSNFNNANNDLTMRDAINNLGGIANKTTTSVNVSIYSPQTWTAFGMGASV